MINELCSMEQSKITKQNGNIAFEEEAHIYYDVTEPNEKFISVTTLIHSFTQPFDKEFWSAYKAVEKLLTKEAWAIEKKSLLKDKKFNKELLDLYNITENDFNREQQAVLDAWDVENRKSCERGTKIHADLENSFYKKKKDIDISKYHIGGKFECVKDYTELDLENGIYPEYLISRVSPDKVLRLAGQIDLLVKKGKAITIADWKGLPLDTEIPTLNGWSTIAELKEGEIIFDKDGNPTKILHKSEVHYNPCYKITFDNGDTIVADHEHRWEISFSTAKTSKYHGEYRTQIMTTEEIAKYLENLPEKKVSYDIPKIINPKPLNLENKELPIDPYVLGCWLGDGSKQCGVITNETNNVLGEIQRRGYNLGDDISAENRTSSYTILGLYSELKKLNLINNKHIPDIYQRASYEQRLDLLRGLMDTDGYYNSKRKRFVMETSQDWQCYDFIKLLSSLGIKSTKFDIIKKLNGKEFHEYSINFSTRGLNPFLMRNQDIEYPTRNACTYRNIDKVELVETIPTQCLEVDSPSHTFLCTDKMIVTHNTNKKIDVKSFFDSKTKTSTKMKYPLNHLDDCNYNHYTLQLSTYAWMIQQLNPEFVIEDLILVHFDHEGNTTVYHLPYLKEDVIKMLTFYKKEKILNDNKNKRKRIEY